MGLLLHHWILATHYPDTLIGTCNQSAYAIAEESVYISTLQIISPEISGFFTQIYSNTPVRCNIHTDIKALVFITFKIQKIHHHLLYWIFATSFESPLLKLGKGLPPICDTCGIGLADSGCA